VLELPSDRARPAVQSYRGAYDTEVIGDGISEGLNGLSQREGTTLFMTMLAVFKVLLYRYSGQTDISIGTPIANRNRVETEGLIGFFVNTLVMRNDLSGEPSFKELLGRVKEAALGAYAHQDLPFEKLVEVLQPERDLSHSPLFQVMFSFQNAPKETLQMRDLKFQIFYSDTGTARFDWQVYVVERPGTLAITFEYNTDLFELETIKRAQQHLRRLIESVLKDPEKKISKLEMMSEDERRQVLVEWNRTETEYGERSVQEMFEQEAESRPWRIAMVYEGELVTYGELNRRANQLAHYLRQLGVGPELLVGIFLERSVEMIVAILGILKAGGAYVPLDRSYPLMQLAFILEDTQTPVQITEERLQDELQSHWGQIICLDADSDLIGEQSQANPECVNNPDNLAYVMYTSGSTGRPKGVGITHRGIVRLVKQTNYVELGREEVMLQLAPVAFDASTFEIWGALLNGGRLVVMPAERASLERVGEAIREHGVTTLWLTARLMRVMVDERLGDLRGLRQLLAGGDVLSAAHVRKVLGGIEGCKVINGYGPTEGTTFTCCNVMSGEEEVGSTVAIGRPISNTRVYIFDGEMGAVPIGVPGGLYIGG